MTVLKVWKTHNDVVLPKHQTSGSACFDLAFQSAGKDKVTGYSASNKPIERIINGAITLAPGDRILVPTGLIFDIPEGYSVRLHARSGMSLKQGLVLANAEGVIDSDYVQETFVMLTNISQNSITINNGERIAQAELVENVKYSLEETISRPGVKTTRTGGFGSTGIETQDTTLIIKTPEVVETPVKRGRGRPKGSKNIAASA